LGLPEDVCRTNAVRTPRTLLSHAPCICTHLQAWSACRTERRPNSPSRCRPMAPRCRCTRRAGSTWTQPLRSTSNSKLPTGLEVRRVATESWKSVHLNADVRFDQTRLLPAQLSHRTCAVAECRNRTALPLPPAPSSLAMAFRRELSSPTHRLLSGPAECTPQGASRCG
jgi:hypothetical protein